MSFPVPGPAGRGPSRVHLIGIGGVGNSAMAEVLLARGAEVSGSDTRPSEVLDRLARLGATVRVGHSAEAVGSVDVVVYSAAVPPDNPELKAALARGITVVERGQFLAQMMDGLDVVAISGTHGKTTTTAMAASMFAGAGVDVTYVVGSVVTGSGAGGHAGSSRIAVVEADEAFGSFTHLDPWIALVTSVDEDHLDHYGTLDELHHAFERFMASARARAIVCADHDVAMSLAPHGALSYGFSSHAELQAAGCVYDEAGRATLTIRYRGSGLGELRVPVPGRHNASNALGAAAAGLAAGLGFPDIVNGIAAFKGTQRRMQYLGTLAGAKVFDDYAHHPVEIEATLEALRLGRPHRLVAVFQPHLFSRTEAMAGQFALALSAADLVIVTEVYGAREDPIEGVDAGLITRAIEGPPTYLAGDLAEAAKLLLEMVAPDDTVVIMGAGDVSAVYGLAKALG